MNFGFPSRFLRKLEIYQQIRSGQGLAKHKRLWRQEAALLQWGYEEHHQHLKNFIVYERAKQEISFYLGKRTRDLREVEQTLGNLYFKGLIDIKFETTSENGDDISIINPPESRIATIEMSKLKLRPSLYGLAVGEVISEINNENIFTKYKNLCKYELAISTIWLILAVGFTKLILGFFDNLLFAKFPLRTRGYFLAIVFFLLIWYLIFFLFRFLSKLKKQ